MFAEAASDLDAAQALGASESALSSARRELALAVGDYAEAERLSAHPSASRISDFDRFAYAAHIRELRNDAAGASLLYAQAEAAYDDTNPVPLAWLYVQQGASSLEAGDLSRARRFFATAHARLPGYTLATEHLAETEAILGNSRRARALYREAIDASNDPTFIDALAALERKAGNGSLAAALERQAREGWERRIARYPAAFSGHAIDYFLDQGEPQRALALARENISNRRDIVSLALLARSAAAAGEIAEACEAWRQAEATGFAAPALRSISDLGRRCTTQGPH
jgi:tetratricopeptide (TPR) repeat protein